MTHPDLELRVRLESHDHHLNGDNVPFAMILIHSVLGSALACKGVQRFVLSPNDRYLAVEVLADDLLHFEVSETRRAPAVDRPFYVTQMVDGDRYQENYKCGPTEYTKSSSSFETKNLKVTIDPNSLSVTVFDKILNAKLTSFSFANLKDPLRVLQWTKEKAQAVYGIASAFAADSIFA